MAGHRNLENRDLEAIEKTFTADIVWHEFGSSRLSGSFTGIAAVMGYWKVYFEAAGPDYRQDILEIMANDDYVTSIVRLSGSKTGTGIDQNAVDIMRMHNGKIAEFWRYYADIAAAHHFMLAPR